MNPRRKRWPIVAGVAFAVLAAGLGIRLAYMWYQPWHETYEVNSVDDEQVCAGTVDLESGNRSREPNCFPTSLLPEAGRVEVGDCVRVTLEHESAEIEDAVPVSCQAEKAGR